jgi:broad specificity phosphatase PhoE
MKIYLIRHSESIDDIEDCYGGIADFDLSENGIKKVEQYEIENLGIEKIYTSPYKRAYQTAKILNKKLNVDLEIIDNIRECNSYGILSGVNKEKAKKIFSYVFDMPKYKNTGYYLGTSFLGGEDINEFDKRVKEGITEIISKSKELNTIAIVTHGGVYRSIYKNILKVDKKLDQMDDLATTELKYNNGKFEIINKQGIVFGETI